MKLVHKDISRDGPGTAKLVPEEADDLWHAYNLISKGDRVSAVTVRKVQRESTSGDRDVERIKLNLEIEVEIWCQILSVINYLDSKAIDYDNVGAVLRIRGKNVRENEHVKIGAFHTLELDMQRTFVLRKDYWDSMAIDTLKQACDPASSADLAVVLMQEGLAQLFLVGASVTTMQAKVETAIPRKRGPAVAGYEKALNKFFENVLQAVLRHCDFKVVRCLVIASSGFTKDQFYKHMMLEAERREIRAIIENKSRIVLSHASSGYRHSLGEVLDSPNVMAMIKDTKAAQEVKALKDFHEMMGNDQTRACYGPKHVQVAHEQLAIQTLLITDELFRNADIPSRKKYVDLVESVKNAGGSVHIFSTMHISGEQLTQLSGIAAILRFPMPELDDLEM